jgi:hypothetical protein
MLENLRIDKFDKFDFGCDLQKIRGPILVDRDPKTTNISYGPLYRALPLYSPTSITTSNLFLLPRTNVCQIGQKESNSMESKSQHA